MEGFETKQEQLKEVETAIYKILVGGQSYKLGSKQLTRADLAELKEMQQRLQSEINAAGGGPLFDDTVVAVFNGR